MTETVTLSHESVDAIAERVAELLENRPTSPDLIDAAEVARRFNVSREYVYEHAGELGAIRLSDGPKARLRFNPQTVIEALAPPEPKPAPARTPRRPRRPSSDVELLPIGPKR